MTAPETISSRVPTLMGELGELGGALVQVAYSGTDAEFAEARQMVARTRRALYRLLATEPEESEPS